MKKYIILLIAMFVCSSLFCYSKNSADDENLKTFTGYVQIYGNEPFTSVGFVTLKHKSYGLKATDDVLLLLRQSQAKKIEITGKLLKRTSRKFLGYNEQKDGSIIVYEWKIIE